jgi:hypothetical protein
MVLFVALFNISSVVTDRLETSEKYIRDSINELKKCSVFRSCGHFYHSGL